MLLNVDDISRLIHKAGINATVIGLSDSSYFLNYDSEVISLGMESDQREHFVGYIDVGNMKYAEEINLKTKKNIYASKMKSIVKMMNLKAGMPSACLKKYEKSPENCIFAENLVETINTPVFILQVRIDPFFSFFPLSSYFEFYTLAICILLSLLCIHN